MRSIELFAGAGGLGIGAGRAGFHPAAVIERDKYCCDTIRENKALGVKPVHSWKLVEGDVRDFDFTSINGKVDFISGGPPCQPFSMGGKHRGYSDQRDMFPQAVRSVREIQPKAFMFENVKGLTRSSFSAYFEYIRLQLTYPELEAKPGEDWSEHLTRLEKYHTLGKPTGLHYNILTQVLNAANYGVPQRRERVFFVGFRSDLNIEWSFPTATHSQDALLWDQVRSGEYWDRYKVAKRDRHVPDRAKARATKLSERPHFQAWQTVRDAIHDLPDPEENLAASGRLHNHRFQPGARSYPGHTGSPLDEPAKTLKAGVHGVPGGENMLRRPDDSVRYFTVRESARLQTFPDDFVFHGSWTETMRQLGNAVPVVLAERIAKDIRSQLRKADKK